jgi:hypothetical protein
MLILQYSIMDYTRNYYSFVIVYDINISKSKILFSSRFFNSLKSL